MISAFRLRILEAIINMHRRREHITVRSVRAKVNRYRSGKNRKAIMTVHNAFVHLRNAGLISYNEHQAATVVPRCRFIPADQLRKDHQ